MGKNKDWTHKREAHTICLIQTNRRQLYRVKQSKLFRIVLIRYISILWLCMCECVFTWSVGWFTWIWFFTYLYNFIGSDWLLLNNPRINTIQVHVSFSWREKKKQYTEKKNSTHNKRNECRHVRLCMCEKLFRYSVILKRVVFIPSF